MVKKSPSLIPKLPSYPLHGSNEGDNEGSEEGIDDGVLLGIELGSKVGSAMEKKESMVRCNLSKGQRNLKRQSLSSPRSKT